MALESPIREISSSEEGTLFSAFRQFGCLPEHVARAAVKSRLNLTDFSLAQLRTARFDRKGFQFTDVLFESLHPLLPFLRRNSIDGAAHGS